MTKRRKKDRGAMAMEVTEEVVPPHPAEAAIGEDMDTTEVEATGAELDLLTASKKKRKKKGKSNGLKVVGLSIKNELQKRKAVKLRKEKSIERALLNMDKQQEKLQQQEVKAERVSSLKNLY